MATNIELSQTNLFGFVTKSLFQSKIQSRSNYVKYFYMINLTHGLRLKMAKAPSDQLNHRFEALRQVHYTKICTENPEGLQLETPKNRILQKVIQTVEVCVTRTSKDFDLKSFHSFIPFKEMILIQ